MRLQQIVHPVAVVFACLETLVRASYYLDDRNSSITYVGRWNRGTTEEPTKLYNGT